MPPVTAISDGCPRLGHAEVQQLGVPTRGNEYVGGLDIAMDDALRVSALERIADLDAEPQDGFGGESMGGDHLAEGLAVEQLHGQERHAVVLSGVVDGADVGVVQAGGGAGLVAEAIEGVLIEERGVRQELEGGLTVKASVLGAIYRAHAAAAQLRQNAVVADQLTDKLPRALHCLCGWVNGRWAASRGQALH
jgi:hypothetical protein